MAFDGFRQWCELVERDLDPGAQMLHFLRQEVPTATEAEWYQVEALTSTASTLALNICRQAGKSSTLAAMGVRELQAGGTTIALCPAERQVRELTRKVQLYLRATDLIVERGTQSEIECNTGGRFIAVPASGATIRGYTASRLLVDEAAWIQDDESIITALLPMLTDDGVVVYASTPAGRNNFFARLFLDRKPNDGIHRITVPGTSIPRLASRVERLRQQLSLTRFRQEVLGEFLADGTSYFDLSAIEQATNPQEGAICPRM